MNEIVERDVEDIIRENYLRYGKEVNCKRSVVGIDGLKISQRRLLLAANLLNNSKIVASMKLIGDALGNYHPHSGDSLVPVVSFLVRRGIFDGIGNHGLESYNPAPSAAARYTKAGMNKIYKDLLFKYSKYSPWMDGEYDLQEPVFLMTPVPIALMTGGGGIGLGGVSSLYPSFTFQSLIEAYQQNDPGLLRSPYNNIEHIDGSKLWNEGKGSITYSLDVKQEWNKDDGCNATVIEGACGGIVPNLSIFDEYVNSGHVFIRDESRDSIKVVVGRTKGTKRIGDDQIFQMCKEASVKTMNFRIMVSYGDKVVYLGIKPWMDITMKLYEDSINKWKKDETEAINKQIDIYTHLPAVAEKLKENKDNKSIAKELKISEEIVDTISKKALRYLRKSDFTEKIDAFKKELEEVNQVSLLSSIVNFKSEIVNR